MAEDREAGRNQFFHISWISEISLDGLVADWNEIFEEEGLK
jgi:hypothetical protein